MKKGKGVIRDTSGGRIALIISALRDLTADIDDVVKRHNRDTCCACHLCMQTRELWAKRRRFQTQQARERS